MSNPKECQGRAYHTPSAANPMMCYRCRQLIHPERLQYESPPRYQGTPISGLKTGDMGE